jgi:hypothetical protein
MQYNTDIMDEVQYRYYGWSTIPVLWMEYNTGIMDGVQYRYYGCSTKPVLWMQYNTGIMDGKYNTAIHNTGIVLHP